MLIDRRPREPIYNRFQKWNESGFRPPLCTYRLNWARRTAWGWWDDWDDTVLQTQDSKFEPWRSEAKNATSRSRRLPTILTFTRGWGRNIFVSFKPPRPGTEPRTLAWKAAVLTTTLGRFVSWTKPLELCRKQYTHYFRLHFVAILSQSTKNLSTIIFTLRSIILGRPSIRYSKIRSLAISPDDNMTIN